MPMPPFQGSITALITPFKNGEVDDDALPAARRMADRPRARTGWSRSAPPAKSPTLSP